MYKYINVFPYTPYTKFQFIQKYKNTQNKPKILNINKPNIAIVNNTSCDNVKQFAFVYLTLHNQKDQKLKRTLNIIKNIKINDTCDIGDKYKAIIFILMTSYILLYN